MHEIMLGLQADEDAPPPVPLVLRGARKTIGFACALAVMSLFALLCLSCGSPKSVWCVPQGQSIRYLRGSGRAGHVLVITKTISTWCLYDISAEGRCVRIASGRGTPQPLVALSGVSTGHDMVVVGMHAKNLSSVHLALCTPPSGRCEAIRGISSAYTFALRQPFSSGGERMAVLGRRGRQVGVWLLGIKDGSRRFLQQETECCDIFALRSRRTAVFERPTGTLSVWQGTAMASQRVIVPGQVSSITPDERSMIVVQGNPQTRVIMADLKTGKRRIVYTRSSWGVPLDIEWSPDGKLAVIFITGPDPQPIVVDTSGRVHSTRSIAEEIKETAGIAFLDSNNLAYVRRSPDGSSECIMRVPVK